MVNIMDFFISDTHFDHKNIIKYCNRPFDTVDEMNETIVERWNEKVGADDTVFFLGDFTFWRNGDGSGDAVKSWVNKLNGRIIFIRGNHDRELPYAHDFLYRKYEDTVFLLRHYADRPDFYPNGWLIHGHEHNNDMALYPFVHRENQTINVSCEMVDYTPVSVEEIMGAIQKYG